MKRNYWKEEELSFSVICTRKETVWQNVSPPEFWWGGAGGAMGAEIREHFWNRVNFEGRIQNNMKKSLQRAGELERSILLSGNSLY